MYMQLDQIAVGGTPNIVYVCGVSCMCVRGVNITTLSAIACAQLYLKIRASRLGILAA